MSTDTLLAPEPQAAPETQIPAGATPAPEISDSILGHIGEQGEFKPTLEAYLQKRGLDKQAGAFSKYKTLDDLVHGFAHAQSLVGKRQEGLRVPGPDAPPEEMEAFQKQLAQLNGVPEAPDGYGIARPEQLPPGVDWDDQAMSDYLAVLHQNGASPKLAKALVEKHMEILGSQSQKYQEQAQESRKQAEAQLKEAWGSNYDYNMKAAQAGVRELSARLPWVNAEDPAFSTPLGVIMAAMLGHKSANDQRPDAAGPMAGGESMAELRSKLATLAEEMLAKQHSEHYPRIREEYNTLTARMIAMAKK